VGVSKRVHGELASENIFVWNIKFQFIESNIFGGRENK